MRTRIDVIGLALGCLVIAACGDSSLANLGGRSSSWIGDPATDDPVAAPVVDPVVAPGVIAWSNDGLGVPSTDDPAQVVLDVVDRSGASDRFIQASRFEIAVALPGLVFPRRLPAEIEAITSQLVVAVGGDRLDDEVFATFGMWTVEPYSKSRSVGQRGVLTIGPVIDSDPCVRLGEEIQVSCTEVDLDGKSAFRLDGESGQTWVWSDEGYEYQMFLRGSIDSNEPDISAMTSSLVPLTDIPVSDETPRSETTQQPGNQETTSGG